MLSAVVVQRLGQRAREAHELVRAACEASRVYGLGFRGWWSQGRTTALHSDVVSRAPAEALCARIRCEVVVVPGKDHITAPTDVGSEGRRG